jgi:hypothetical protein
MIKLFVFSVLALTSSSLYGQDPCPSRLVPNVDASKLDEVTKYSFLQLINTGNYGQVAG